MKNNDNSVLSFIYNLYQFPGQGQGRGRGDTQDFIAESGHFIPFPPGICRLTLKYPNARFIEETEIPPAFFPRNAICRSPLEESLYAKSRLFGCGRAAFRLRKAGRLLTRYGETDIIIKTAYNSNLPSANPFSVFPLSKPRLYRYTHLDMPEDVFPLEDKKLDRTLKTNCQKSPENEAFALLIWIRSFYKRENVMTQKQTLPPEPDEEDPSSLSKANNAHCKYFTETFKNVMFAISFVTFALRDTLILPLLDLSKLKLEKRRFFDRNIFRESFADMIYSVPFINDPKRTMKAFILLEHKSYNDILVIFQVAYYTMQILFNDFVTHLKTSKSVINYRLPLVLPIIIHHGKYPFTGSTELRDLFPNVPEFLPYLFNLKAILIDLNRIPLEELPNDPNVWQLNVVLKVMKLVFNGDQRDDIEECFQTILPYIGQSPEQKEFALLTVRYYWEASNSDPDWFAKMITNNYPEINGDIDMLTMREQVYEKGRTAGREEGMEKGRKEGREEGREAQIKIVRKILRARFGQVPVAISRKVREMSDSVAFQSLAVTAAICASLKEFQENL